MNISSLLCDDHSSPRVVNPADQANTLTFNDLSHSEPSSQDAPIRADTTVTGGSTKFDGYMGMEDMVSASSSIPCPSPLSKDTALELPEDTLPTQVVDVLPTDEVSPPSERLMKRPREDSTAPMHQTEPVSEGDDEAHTTQNHAGYDHGKTGVNKVSDYTVDVPIPAPVPKRKKHPKDRAGKNATSANIGLNDEGEPLSTARGGEDLGGSKLYCICKRPYDTEKVMIACDRCDEWYHAPCIGMADQEIDLIDQFICPVCIAGSPGLASRTTYQQRCLFGAEILPTSCFKPARGPLSKYCSDDCGLQCIEERVSRWESENGRRGDTWSGIQSAERPQGLCVTLQDGGIARKGVTGVHSGVHSKRTERLRHRLDGAIRTRKALEHTVEFINWRENAIYLAISRAQSLNQCGWDPQLCFSEEDWSNLGEECMLGYQAEELACSPHRSNVTEIDGHALSAERWCRESIDCERHQGWQKLRTAEISVEKQSVAAALEEVVTKEKKFRNTWNE